MASAAFFDIFGLVAFAILLYLGIKLLKIKSVPDWIGSLITAIAVMGLVVDGVIVFRTYIFGG
jgi:hypothetical protein